MDPAQNNEQKRISVVKSINDIIDSSRFDKITHLTSLLFSLPVSGVSLVEENKVYFKSLQGLELKEIERKGSFSDLAITASDIVIIEDTLTNDYFKFNPLVVDGPKIRFYAGVPIISSEGFIVGEFFIAGPHPRNFTDFEKSVFKDLSAWVTSEIISASKLSLISQEQIKFQQELARSNRELQAGKARDDAMLESIGDGVIGINDKGEVTFINKPVEFMTGWKQEELLRKPLWYSIKMLDEEGKEVPVSSTPLRNALYLKKRITDNNHYYVRKNGSKFPVAITATPVVIFERVMGGVVVFRDVTKEKEIDRMKTEFISLASHQLRTPLSAMKWFCEILLDGDAGGLNQEQKEMVGNIYQSNERMIDLVNTLLNISRIESGRIIIDPKPTDLRKLIDEVILEVKPKLDKKKLHLGISMHAKLPLVTIDPKLVRHVYMNLLTNAIKYTPIDGQIVVIVSLSGNEIISQVSDSGYGIPKDQQQEVFKKFFRAENIIKIETDGTGLGLYLTKAIVESSGGRIWFESEEGKGTTFWFAIPSTGSVQKKGEVSIDA